MPQLKNEELTLNDKIKFDNKGGAILGVLEGPVADFIHPTRNGRDYTEALWENVWKNPIVKEQFENGGIVGELDHPADRDDICTEKVAVIMPEPPVKKNGEYYGKFNILDTPCGRIVYTLAKAGFKLGVSSRGTGDVDDYTNTVDPDTYEFTCFDVVLLPAVKSARMNLVTEGLDKKKNYKQLLKESIEKSNDTDKKIMKETLNNLNIKLDEDMEEKEKCVICGEPIIGYGNNPAPVKEEGKCCDKCNVEVVLPARLQALNDSKGKINEAFDEEPEIGGEEKVVPAPEGVTFDLSDGTGEPKEVTVKDGEIIDEPTETDEDENCNAKLIELLHKFLEKENIEVEEDEDIKNIEQDFIDLFHDTICQEEEQPEKVEGEVVEVNPETTEVAEDDGTLELMEQLQKLLKENKALKEEVSGLQNEKAVSGTKVNKLTEDLNTYKAIAAKAGKRALNVKDLESQNSKLADQVKKLTESVQKQQEKEKLQESRISKLVESKTVLENKLNLTSNDSKEIQRLNEEVKSIKVSYTNKLNEANKRYQSSLKLVEKYKGLAHDVAERYMEAKAVSLGITVNEIKNRLNESYTLDDVDKVCEDLRKYSLNISKLPFAFDKPGARVRIREDKSINALSTVNNQYDEDEVDDYLLDLAKLNKK